MYFSDASWFYNNFKLYIYYHSLHLFNLHVPRPAVLNLSWCLHHYDVSPLLPYLHLNNTTRDTKKSHFYDKASRLYCKKLALCVTERFPTPSGAQAPQVRNHCPRQSSTLLFPFCEELGYSLSMFKLIDNFRFIFHNFAFSCSKVGCHSSEQKTPRQCRLSQIDEDDP